MVLQIHLQLVNLYDYYTGAILQPLPHHKSTLRYWRKADLMVWSILMSSLSNELIPQIGHLPTSAKIWHEAYHICTGQSIMDFTLTIFKLIHTPYTNEDNIAKHIAKMQELCQHLVMLGHNLSDNLFAVFLWLLMPQDWNYMFAGLPEGYDSNEIECHIWEEYAVCYAHKSSATAYAVSQSYNNGSLNWKEKTKPKPEELYCINCKSSGHWISGCWSRGGDAEGKGPKYREGQQDKDEKGKERANKAIEDNEASSSKHELVNSCYMTSQSSTTHSHSEWILNSGASTHICNDKSTFTNLWIQPGLINVASNSAPGMKIIG